jgi:tRNA nucleotidyltransferase (CCA-adding enzyme)
MKKYLEKLPKEILDLIYLARDIANSGNMPVYLVGGFVRDLLLGVKNLDLDIVVEGDGIKFAEDFAGRLKAKLTRHRRFGTATILFSRPHLKIDIASSRKEFYPQPGHLPLVTRGILKDDLFRRDFTINAMAISISYGNFGELMDLFGGKADLENKKVRVLHNFSFRDDPTRILRAARFEKRYNFSIEPGTLKLIKEAARLKMLENVEPQRIRDELILTLKEEHPIKEIRRLQDLGALSFISPHAALSKRTYRLLRSIERQVSWFERELRQRRILDRWLMYFIGLTDFLAIRDLKSICNKFAFRKGEEKRILGYKKINHRFISVLNKKEIRPSRIFALLEPLSYEVILLLKAKYKNPPLQEHIERFFKEYNGMRIHISGHDLHNLGIAPSPDYQKIFKKILNAKLNGLVTTKEEEMALLRKVVRMK